jgi:hypothetical protein
MFSKIKFMAFRKSSGNYCRGLAVIKEDECISFCTVLVDISQPLCLDNSRY